MGRRVTVGILPGGIGQTFFSDNTISSAGTDQNLKITADGTGVVEILKSTNVTGDLQLNAQGDVRFADSDSSNYVAIQGPATVTSNYTVTLPAAVATANGMALVSDTSGNTSWAPADPFAGSYTSQTGSFTASSFNCYFVDTSSTAITATLPSSPAVGDTIRFFDVAKTFDSNALTVARNGKLIQGDSADLTVNSESAAFDLVFSGNTYGWRIFSI
jgi:hypothetical protein